MNSGVYLITNTKSGKKYIGSSVNLANRKNVHLCNLRKQRHSNAHLQNAYNKYGEDKFEFRTLALCAREKKSLLALEQYYIDLLNPEYNILPVAGSRMGIPTSDETRVKMSEANRGIVFSAEHREKLSKAARGRKLGPRSTEYCAKMSEAMKGNKNALGYKHGPMSAETKAKIGIANKGKLKGKPWSKARRAAQEARQIQGE